jgi:uncharacterized paraquat-inducible protein A
MIRAACPSCNYRFQEPDANAGKVLACPACKKSIRMPENVSTPAPEPNESPTGQYTCPVCGTIFMVSKADRSGSTRCPECKTVLRVDALSSWPQLPYNLV